VAKRKYEIGKRSKQLLTLIVQVFQLLFCYRTHLRVTILKDVQLGIS